MKKVDLHRLLDGKWEDGTRPKDLYADHVAARPETYVETIVAGLDAPGRRVQNGCAELASLLSEAHPELLYPHVDRFAGNLGAKEKVVRWEAVCTVGNLAAADRTARIPPHLPAILPLLENDSIVLQGHAVRALAKIARAHPDRADEIFAALLRARKRFPGNRIGFLVEAMESFLDRDALKPKIRKFVTPLAESEIKSVATKARRVLRKLKD